MCCKLFRSFDIPQNKSSKDWDESDMNRVLTMGNELYIISNVVKPLPADICLLLSCLNILNVLTKCMNSSAMNLWQVLLVLETRNHVMKISMHIHY